MTQAVPASLSPQILDDDRQQAAEVRGGLLSLSFLGLLVTQFLGATNDNIFRWLVVFLSKDLVEAHYRRGGAAVSPEVIHQSQQLAVSLGLGLLVLPFILLAAPAGYVADRFSKRNVMIGCKVAEVVLMSLGIAAILNGNIFVLFAVLFLMGSQSAMFGPSKYGSIPEIVRDDRIQAANGFVGMSTIVAIVAGTVIGGVIYSRTWPLGRHDWWISACVLVGVAATGLATSLLVRLLPVANPARPLPVNFIGQMIEDLRALVTRRALLLAALGSATFWFLAGLCNVNVERLAAFDLAVTPRYAAPLIAVLALGVGAGNIAAGVWSRGRVELGLVPFGAAGVALGGLLLFTVPQSEMIVVSATMADGQGIKQLEPMTRTGAVEIKTLSSSAYGIRLTRRPTADVVVDVLPPDELAVDRGQLEFTPDDWDQRQQVRVTALPEKLKEDVQSARITHVTRSRDAYFNGLGNAWSTAYVLSMGLLFCVGFSGGLYDVPLMSFLQQRSPEESRGAILAAANVITCSAIVFAAAAFYLLSGTRGLSGRSIFLILGLLALPVAVVAGQAVAYPMLYLFSDGLARLMYRFEVKGLENLPEEGGVLLVPNHVTWLDGFFLGLNIPRRIRFVVYADYFNGGFLRWFGGVVDVIPIHPGKRSIIASLRKARDALENGKVVCMFAEGGLSRSGRLEAFQPGFLRALKGTDAPVVPVYLGGLWGSLFSFERGRFFWKLPRRWPYRVTVRFGKPIYHPADVEEVRQAVIELGRLEGDLLDQQYEAPEAAPSRSSGGEPEGA